MKRTLLLLAGSPGTGKTYFDNLIRKEIPGFNETSIDVFKESMYDEYGFNNQSEKNELDEKAYKLFYKSIESLMEQGKSIICDYPFSYRQHDTLEKLAEKYNFQIITITLRADLNILYERQKKRDLDPERHLGYLMNHYHKGDVVEDRTKVDIQRPKEEFEAFNQKRDYAHFKLGKTIFLNVSDFSKVDYTGTIEKIKSWIK
ncbi:AAA family ATPase [Lactobacillus sp. ESL0791]|uniref:AAA family ATPase n=1 Tax=Lactobacillus sp. ESL0791 TaxID=2983234 RepID=UPI0023F66528|nr:AAA family ATPase [Lactobacillus sp. ESL0791]MDF7639491.1 AAA family ATPase [Lactobacillus sp. ESL0791]